MKVPGFCAYASGADDVSYNFSMTPTTKRWLVRGVKIVLALLILFFVGRQFKNDLESPHLEDIQLRPAWLVASGFLYMIGLYPSAWFWRHLHKKLGYPIPFFAAFRAHYLSQLGKYVPGKAIAIAIRADLTHPYGVPFGVSIIITFYEVLTMMAAGAIIGALIYAIEPPTDLGLQIHPALIGVLIIAMCGLPLLPGVFNFIIAKLTARLQAMELYRLPPVRFDTLARGLAFTGLGWWVQGAAFWAMLQAVVPEPPDASLYWWAQCTAAIGFANAAGFVVIVLPAGFGVRESLLKALLSRAGETVYIAASVLLLRLDWIVTELLFAAILFWIKPAAPEAQAKSGHP